MSNPHQYTEREVEICLRTMEHAKRIVDSAPRDKSRALEQEINTLRLMRMTQQPVGERRLAAIERLNPMRCSERLRSQQAHFPAQTGRRDNRSVKPGLSDSGRSSMSRIAWY